MANREPAPFGALLLHMRAAAGLTQEQLAARAGLSPNAIAALERGKRRIPRAVTVERLATALGLEARGRDQLVAAARAPVRGAEATENARATASDEVRDERVVRDARRHTWWPAGEGEPTPLVDRAHELNTIVQLLAGDDGAVQAVHLLTLIGPAGVGKTRLAVAAAAKLAQLPGDVGSVDPGHFPDGVVFVDLAPIRDPALVLSRLASAVGLLDFGSRRLTERLTDVLCERRLLVVLDNVEQLLPAAAAPLADLLASCPGLVLLVTSRVPLQLRWERTLRIPPLPVPDPTAPLPPLQELAAIPAVALFVQRVRAHQADFVLSEQQARVVTRLVSELDGLPLALELAAARTAALPLSVIASRLGDRLRLLRWDAGDVPARQRSLEAAVGWSYDLLDEDEQRLFRCLGVFSGRVALDAIAAVVTSVTQIAAGGTGRVGGVGVGERGADGGKTLEELLSLAEQSLLLPVRTADLLWQQGGHGGQGVIVGADEAADAENDEEEADPEPAFGMLETVRAYAAERLAAAGELEAARRAHASYFLALAERAEPELHRHAQRSWFFRLEREHDNLRAALRWLLERVEQDGSEVVDTATEREAGLRLAGALGWFWLMRGYHAEGLRWLEEGLARAPGAAPAARTQVVLQTGLLLTYQGNLARARSVLEDALALSQQRDDRAGIAEALTYLGTRALFAGDLAEAVRLGREALARWEALGATYFGGHALYLLGTIAFAQGDEADAVAPLMEALERFDALGDAQLAGFVHCYLGVVAWKRGELPSAARHVRAGVQTSLTLRDRWLLGFGAQATVALVGAWDDPAARASLLGAADALDQATGTTFATLVWQHLPAGQDVVGLRERLTREGGECGAAYRAGRALPFREVATLALRLLDEVAAPRSQAEAGHDETLPQPAASGSHNPLTAREREVLRLVAEGRSSKAIGEQLFLSPSTINQHLKTIFNKLGVDTRAQAVAVAARRGLL